MAIHSSILAWRIPWKRSLAGYTVLGVARAGHDLATKPPQINFIEGGVFLLPSRRWHVMSVSLFVACSGSIDVNVIQPK